MPHSRHRRDRSRTRNTANSPSHLFGQSAQCLIDNRGERNCFHRTASHYLCCLRIATRALRGRPSWRLAAPSHSAILLLEPLFSPHNLGRNRTGITGNQSEASLEIKLWWGVRVQLLCTSRKRSGWWQSWSPAPDPYRSAHSHRTASPPDSRQGCAHQLTRARAA